MKKSSSIPEINKKLVEFEKENWVVAKDTIGKTRHITLHLGKLIGKIAEVAERREHDIEPDLKILKSEVIPDLLIYSLQLANIYNVNLEKSFFTRLAQNKKRVKSWKKK